MKRIITFMMALALVLSLSVTAFAAGTGSITITNATKDMNYKLYKIFDATYVDGGTDVNGNNIVDTVAYSLKSDSPVCDYMFDGLTPDAEGVVFNDYFTYNTKTGVITRVDTATKETITAYLTEMVRELYKNADNPETAKNDGCFVANQVAATQEVAFIGLDYGYYLIDTAKATDTEADKAKIAVTITTNTPAISVIEKNQLPGGDFSKDVSNDGITWETDNQNSLRVGDTVYFKLSFTATNYDGDEKVTYYKITDTMNPANWADIVEGSFVVKVAGRPITNYTRTETDTGFEINIPWVNGAGEFLYTEVTSAVEVTYNAVVTENAAGKDGAQANKNSAQLDWDYDSEPDAPGDETETDVYNLGFTKVDGTDLTKTLAGAIFALYSDDDCTIPVNVERVSEGVYMVNPEVDSNEVETPVGGQVVIMGLAEGTYYLMETEAPEGYNKLAGAVEVEVGGSKTIDMVIGEETYKVSNDKLDIANNSGAELPSTGGEGTMMMITFGTLIAMVFAVLLITHKKMSVYHD